MKTAMGSGVQNKTKAAPVRTAVPAKPAAVLSKAEPDGDEGGGEAEGDHEEPDGDEAEEVVDKAKKSADVTTDDLEKSLQRMEALVAQEDTTSRKEALLQKAQTQELSKAERAELFQILGGGDKPAEETLGEQVTKSLQPGDDNQGLKDAIEVSAYLRDQHQSLMKSLGVLSEHIEQSDNRQHTFNLVLAKAVADTGRLVKSMAEAFQTMAAQPVRAPKSVGAQPSRALEKSFAGQPAVGGGEELSKAEILDSLTDMMKSSCDAGHKGMWANENLLLAVGKFEQTNQISKGLLAEVQKFRSAQGAVTH